MTDSEHFMDLDVLPERVAFIGGGFISFEFAHMARAAGCRVTIVHRGSQVLRGFDPDLADMLAWSYRGQGIEVRVGAPVTALEGTADGLRLRCAQGDAVEADLVVHGAGRIPDLEALELDAAGVEVGRRGIAVDRSMRSVSNPRVFAIGDAAALGPALTPVGIAQGRVAARAILGEAAAYEPAAEPSVVFSDPPLARVGLDESAAREQGLDVEVRLNDMTGWTSSRRLGLPVAGAKTIVDRATGRLVGAHLLGHGADEVINLYATAIMGGLTADELRSAVWAYPTAGYEIAYLL